MGDMGSNKVDQKMEAKDEDSPQHDAPYFGSKIKQDDP